MTRRMMARHSTVYRTPAGRPDSICKHGDDIAGLRAQIERWKKKAHAAQAETEKLRDQLRDLRGQNSVNRCA